MMEKDPNKLKVSKPDLHHKKNDYYNSSRSEGEICSDPEPPEDVRKKRLSESRDRDRDDRRRKDKKKSRDSSRGHSRTDTKDKQRKDNKYRRRWSSSSRSRSRSRDTSRSRSRSVSRSRHRSRGKYRRRRRDRSYDSHTSNESDDRGDRRTHEKIHDSYKYQDPNNTIMVRGLEPHLTEMDIRQDVLKCGICVKDIRLIRNRDTGVSRGFAFVEFNTVQEATRWMEMKKGVLHLEEHLCQANLIYSVPKSLHGVRNLFDWNCKACGTHNFKRRDLCYKCQNPKPEVGGPAPAVSDDISSHPTSTLILGGLDTLTTEEDVLEVFEANPELASMPIKSVRVDRESITNMSRGVCYVEVNNLSDAVRLHTALLRASITIDSRLVSISYCKPSTSGSTNNSVAATAMAAARWTNSNDLTTSSGTSDADELERLAQHSASVYAKTPEEHASYLEYYREYFRKRSTKGSDAPTKSQKESESSRAATSYRVNILTQPACTGTDKKQTKSSKDIPDTGRFLYDASCGYYYDPVSELYYDPNTHYYYDSRKQQFLHWNGDEQLYVPVVSVMGSFANIGNYAFSAALGKDENRKDSKIPEKQEKVKVAKEIVQKMEKWAKSLTQKKDYSKAPAIVDTGSNISSSDHPPESQTHESFDSSYPHNRNALVSKLSTVQPEGGNKIPLSSYDACSSSEEQKTGKITNSVIPSSHNFADYIKMACLLCKRQFLNNQALDKHTELSDLHKQNMDKFLKQNQTDGNSIGTPTSYRDRAQERRNKFGPDKQEATNLLTDLYINKRNNTDVEMHKEPSKPVDIGYASENVKAERPRSRWQ